MDADRHIAYALILLALIFASGFFVSAEFAVLTLRRRRVEQVDPDANGRSAPPMGADEAEDIALVGQVGSALAALCIGVVAASWAVSGMPRLVPIGAAAIGISAAAIPYIVLGQQIPRFLGANRPTLVTNPIVYWPMRSVAFVLRPVLAVLSIVLNALSDALNLSRTAFYAPVHTPADIRELVRHGHEQGVVEEDEHEMIHGVFEFSDTIAREVMTPRIGIVAVPRDLTLPELLKVVVEEGHSRIPVFDGSIDNIVGVLLTKDLLPVLANGIDGSERIEFDITKLIREPFFVPDTKPVDDILAEFRKYGVHLAVVIDEFGGTYGLLTMEDLLEEIVGEIHDEHDVEEPDFAATPEGDVLIDGSAAISDVNERFGLGIPESDFDTIGGYIFGALGRVAVPGDVVEGIGERGDQVLTVEEMDDRRVALIRLRGVGMMMSPES